MILRSSSVPETVGQPDYPAPFLQGIGGYKYRHLTDAGGLTQFGIALEVLEPGGQTSQPHWESTQDEFLYVLEGALTVVEDGVESLLSPGDACCWKAGMPIAHTLRNHSGAPATYLIAGSRTANNMCHYPGLDLLDTPAGFTHLDGTPYPQKGESE